MEPLTDPLNPTSPSLLAGRMIVVIDDDCALLSMMQTYLRRAGATVHTASNGRDALALLESLSKAATPVHAILCDLRMDGGSGMELYHQLGDQHPALQSRMIFSSGDVDGDDVRSFIDACCVQVLAKPYPLAELRRMLAELPPPA